MQSAHASAELSLASANNVEAVRIDTSQRVGIGTSNPSQRLHTSASGTSALIDGNSNGNNPVLHVRDRTDTFVALFEGNRAGDTGAAIAIRHNPASAASTNRTRLNFQMPDNGGTATTYAQLASFINSNTNTSEEGHLKINTMTGGSVTEHLHIGNNKISGSAASTGSFGTVEASHFTGDGAGLTNVPDYVFEPEYILKPLNELETFVSQSKHLPGIPSMDAMHEWKKYSVGDRDMMLLEKIEELTLHVIRLEKRIKDLENN